MDKNLISSKDLLNALYDDRKNYTIVALTGYTGTGCTSLANLMASPFTTWTDLRLPKDLIISKPDILENDDLFYKGQTNHKSISESIFARKYAICFDYLNSDYSPFEIIKYSNVLLLYCCKYWYDQKQRKEDNLTFQDFLKEILSDKFRPSRDERDDSYRKLTCKSQEGNLFNFDSEQNLDYPWKKAHGLDNFNFNEWEDLERDIKTAFLNAKIEPQAQPDNKDVKDNEDLPAEKDVKKDLRDLGKLFFSKEDVFNRFASSLITYLWSIDPYCTDFFFHRLGYVLRASGNPLKRSKEVYDQATFDGRSLYSVVSLINILIKSFRKWKPDTPCRLVIDKLRNSLEAKFLKERYSAFYFVAVHEEKEVSPHLRDRIIKNYSSQREIDKNENILQAQIAKILHLDAKERESGEFENGKFYSPNTSQCVADAEIHISNEMGNGKSRPLFFSMSEQWMKYASLIQHPGLITPSSEERCMVVAFTAKFNSGCLSRQVGAVITNKAHTIRTIGWNDVPYGHIPCSLRELKIMATGKGDYLGSRRYFYSQYEVEDTKPFKDGQTFNEKVRLKYQDLHLDSKNELMEGFPYSYCFKSLQNEFDKEKNQVHTRSLHAEENAILQMAKYGGEPLHDGIIYVTASPCELCCKKLYQIGVRKIVYIDEYPGISRENIIGNGFHRPKLKQFQGAYGATYFKLYQPLIPYKEELKIRKSGETEIKNSNYNDRISKELSKILKTHKIDSDEKANELIERIKECFIDK